MGRPRQARWVAWLGSLAALACGVKDLEYSALPPSAGKQSAILALLEGEKLVEARAIDLGNADRPIKFTHESASALTLEALVYDESLIQLGFEEDFLAPDPAGSRDLLKDADARYRRSVGGSEGWVRVDELSEALTSFRTKDSLGDHCPTLEIEASALGDDSSVEVLLPLGERSALMSTRLGALFRWEDGAITKLTCEPNMIIAGATQELSGPDVYLINTQGELFRIADISGDSIRLDRVAGGASPSRRYFLHVRRDAAGLFVVSLGLSGRLERLVGTSFEVLHDFTHSEEPASVGFAVDSNQTIYAASPLSALAVRYRGLEVEPLPASPAAGFLALGTLADIPGLGLIGGDGDGRFWVLRGQTWEELGGSPLKVFPYAIRAHAGGFVYGAALGNFGFYRPGVGQGGYCPVERVSRKSGVFVMPLGARSYLFTGDTSGEDSTLFVVTEKPPGA